MEIRCPRCQTVFTTSTPGSQPCPHCGHTVDAGMPGPGAPPPPGSPDLHQGRGPTPWERRAELGFIQGLFQQWKETILSPEAFWVKVRPDAPARDALFYGWLVSVLAALIQAPFTILQISLQSSQMQTMFDQMALPEPWASWLERLYSPGGSVFLAVYGILVATLMYPLQAIIGAAIVHLFAMIFGCAKNGFWATFRVLGYATAPLVFQGIPLVGLGAAIWSLVLSIWGMMRVQETTGGRAAAAVLGFPVLLLCLCCALGMLAMFGAVAALGAR